MTYTEAINYVYEVFQFWKVQHLDYDSEYDKACKATVEALSNMEGMLAKAGCVHKIKLDSVDNKNYLGKLNCQGSVGLWATPQLRIGEK